MSGSTNPNPFFEVWDISSSTPLRIGNRVSNSTENQFGKSVSINNAGTRVIIGVGQSSKSNGAYVYEYNEINNTWGLLGNIITFSGVNSYLGEYVKMNGTGNRIAVSDRIYNSNKGRVIVFDYNYTSNTWEVVGSATE